MPAKKIGSRKGASASRGTGKRERMSPNGDARFVRRDGKGRFNESDDMGRSLAADRRTKSKTKAASGYGDKGDRASAPSRRRTAR